MTGERMVLAAVASFGLPGAAPDLPPRPLANGTWSDLVDGARRHRLTGLLAQAAAAGALPTTSAQAEELKALGRQDLCRTLALEALLLDTVDRLGAADVDTRVLKGASIAHLDYPDPSLRGYIDVDLLVPPEAFDRAVEVLTSNGHVRQFPELSPGFDRRFGKGATLRSPVGAEVDLHRTFDRGPFGLAVRIGDLWATTEPFRLGGRTVWGLGPVERFLGVCFHAALGNVPPRLVPLRDVAQMLANDRLDVPEVRTVASAWRCEAVVARAVGLAMSTLALPATHPLARWATRYEPDRREARALALYVDRGQTHGARVVAIARTLPGLGNRLAYLRAVLLPSRTYRSAVATTPLARLRSVREPWRFLDEDLPASPR